MRWEDERYVKVYTRDTADWLALSFDAQALFCLLLRKVDRAGVFPLGRQGKKAVAITLGQAALWPRLEPALDELVADGCVLLDGDRLIIRNFLEAQEAKQSDRARQAKSRETARAVTNRDELSRNVTPESHGVTRGHSESQVVTPSLAVPSRAEPVVCADAPAPLPPKELAAPAPTIPAPQPPELFNPADLAALTGKPDKPPAPRKLSRWQALHAELEANRRAAFPNTTSDEVPDTVVLNADFKAIDAEVGEAGIRASHAAWLKSPNAATVGPPGAVKVWLKTWRRYLRPTAPAINPRAGVRAESVDYAAEEGINRDF